MCKPHLEIHFCSCADLKAVPYPGSIKNQVNLKEYQKTHFIWSLNRYLGSKNSQMMGQIMMPTRQLSQELSLDHLTMELCKIDIFDFDYAPKSGDNLIIEEEYIYKAIRGTSRPDLSDYMSLIYKDGCWQDDFYNVFTDKTRKFKKGLIKLKPLEESS